MSSVYQEVVKFSCPAWQLLFNEATRLIYLEIYMYVYLHRFWSILDNKNILKYINSCQTEIMFLLSLKPLTINWWIVFFLDFLLHLFLISISWFPPIALSTSSANKYFPLFRYSSRSSHSGFPTRADEQELVGDLALIWTEQFQSENRWKHHGRNGLRMSVHYAEREELMIQSDVTFWEKGKVW